MSRVSVQGVKSLGGHFACLCREFEIYEVKKKILNVGPEFLTLMLLIKKTAKEGYSRL